MFCSASKLFQWKTEGSEVNMEKASEGNIQKVRHRVAFLYSWQWLQDTSLTFVFHSLLFSLSTNHSFSPSFTPIYQSYYHPLFLSIWLHCFFQSISDSLSFYYQRLLCSANDGKLVLTSCECSKHSHCKNKDLVTATDRMVNA